MARAFSANRTFRNPAGSNTSQSGIPQGTMGGPAVSASSKPGRWTLQVGDEMYLWAILLLEVGLMAFLRNHFRRYHGG